MCDEEVAMLVMNQKEDIVLKWWREDGNIVMVVEEMNGRGGVAELMVVVTGTGHTRWQNGGD